MLELGNSQTNDGQTCKYMGIEDNEELLLEGGINRKKTISSLDV